MNISETRMNECSSWCIVVCVIVYTMIQVLFIARMNIVDTGYISCTNKQSTQIVIFAQTNKLNIGAWQPNYAANGNY